MTSEVEAILLYSNPHGSLEIAHIEGVGAIPKKEKNICRSSLFSAITENILLFDFFRRLLDAEIKSDHFTLCLRISFFSCVLGKVRRRKCERANEVRKKLSHSFLS